MSEDLRIPRELGKNWAEAQSPSMGSLTDQLMCAIKAQLPPPPRVGDVRRVVGNSVIYLGDPNGACAWSSVVGGRPANGLAKRGETICNILDHLKALEAGPVCVYLTEDEAVECKAGHLSPSGLLAKIQAALAEYRERKEREQ